MTFFADKTRPIADHQAHKNGIFINPFHTGGRDLPSNIVVPTPLMGRAVVVVSNDDRVFDPDQDSSWGVSFSLDSGRPFERIVQRSLEEKAESEADAQDDGGDEDEDEDEDELLAAFVWRSKQG